MVTDKIARARQLLATVRHATMATVNQDGSPHNSPFYFMYEPDLSRLYWSSHETSQHTRNIERTGQLFVVLFDAFKRGGGLYIQAEQGHKLQGQELAAGIAAHNRARARENRSALDADFYAKDNGQCMYGADITGLWVNQSERSSEGYVVRDYRHKITAADLLAARKK